MDLLYLSEGFPFHPMRSGYTYDKYESQQKNQAKSSYHHKKQPAPDSHKSGDSCKLCREKQKRALSTYIRSKSMESQHSKNTITEECEEE